MKPLFAKLSAVFAITVACLLVVGLVGTAAGQTWTPLNNKAPVSMGAMLLLTDGRVLVHEEPNCSGTGCVGTSYSNWYTLTPDVTGSYVNGTWTEVASLPSGYDPLFFSSAVLPDGKVAIQGGEYNCPGGSCADPWQSLGALYDPVANTWTSLTPEIANSDKVDGDSQSVVLPNGTWMTAACCAKYGGFSSYPEYYYFNESSLNFTNEASASDGETTEFDESGWNLMPNGEVLMVNVYLGSYSSSAKGYAIYNPSTNTWTEYSSTAVQLWDDGCGNSNNASYELGPLMLMPNGTYFATGASECEAGNLATYNWSTNTWTAQGTFPNKDAANDAPGATEINGNAIVMSSPYSGTFNTPSTFYEWNGTTLSTFPNPANAANDASYVGHLLVLPTGQIMFTDFTTGVEILTSAGTYQSAWQPTITTAPYTLTPGTTYSISGTQFNGVSTGASYGDDFQDYTNYPLVRIVNSATGDVYYARTHGHSTMGVATGSTAVSTNFDVPSSMPNGPCELYVVANGIPSAASACNVGATLLSTTTSVSSSANPSAYGQTVTFTATVSGSSGTPTGTVQFTDNSIVISGCSAVALSSGTAQCIASGLSVGSQTIVATYSGSSSYSGSTGSLSQVVNQASTTTAVTSSLNPSSYGQAVSFTAHVTGSSPTGTVQFNVDGSAFGSPVTLSSGSAISGSTSTLAVGTHTVTATYSGNTNNSGSTGTLSGGQVVHQVSTTTAVASSLNPSSYGQSASFTATVTGSSPTGTVQFNVDGSAFGSPVTLASGSASSGSISTLAQGTHTVTATYSGDTNNGGSTGTLSGGQVVNAAGASVSVASGLNPSTYGQSVTFTATISGANGLVKGRKNGVKPMTVTGTVTWSANTGCGTTPVTSGNTGTASCTTSSLPVGASDTVTASYSGDSNHNAGSGSVSQTVNQVSSSVSVVSSLNPSSYGQAVSFTASVTGSSPTGTVQFYVDSALFDTETLASGSATSVSTSSLAVGTHTVTATYSGDTDNSGSTGTLSGGQVVTAAGAGSITVNSGLNPSTYGQSVTFTASIPGQYGLVRGRKPNGKNGAKPETVTGTVTWSVNTGCGTTAVTSGTPGTATCTTSGLPVGASDTVTANYSGDSNHSSGSGSVNQQVNQVGSSTAVSSSLNPSSYGQAVSFTATVTGSSPTGTVQFYVDSALFDTETLASGSATSVNTSSLAAGTHTVTATYSGDTDNAGSTGTLSGGQVVNAAGANVSVASSLNPSTSGQSVTFTATISGANGLVRGRNGKKPMDVSGTVAWSTNTGCGTTPVTSGNPGSATCTTTSLPVGTDAITATYSGDSNHAGGTGTLSGGQVVNSSTVSTTTAVSSSLNPSGYGQAVSFTASVSAASGTPTGTVQFSIDGNAFGSPVTLASGTASSGSISTLAVGTHTASAAYTPGTGFLASTGTLAGGQVVNSAGANVSVASGLNPSTYGQSVTFTATISGANGLVKGRKPLDVTGTVTWSGNTGCGTTSVTSGNPGTATCTTSGLGGGTDTITAAYSGDSNHSSGSGTLSGGQVVNPASQTITFSTNAPASAAYNSSFTVAASASSGLAVSFSSGGSCSNSGATYTITSGSGTCSVTASQAGNSNYSAAPNVTQTTNATPASQTIDVTTGAPSTATNKSSFTVVANASSGLAITYGSSGSCTNSGATYTIDKASGTCTVTMTQAGNGNYSAAATVTEKTTVTTAVAPAVSLTGEPATATEGEAFTVTASSNETGAVSIPVISTTTPTICSVGSGTTSGSSVTATVTMLIGTGTCDLEATWAANYVYSAATAKEHTTAAKIAPTVSFTGAPASAANGSNFTVTATSNEGGSYASTPTITATPATVCTVGAVTSNGPGSYQATVTMIKASGTCTTKAAWTLNSDYAAASATQKTTATQ